MVKTPKYFAITGYSYRLPGGLHTDEDFWQLLSQRKIVQEPVTRRYGRGYSPVTDLPSASRMASPYEGLLRDDEELMFDRGLFGISHYEVSHMQPQVRMLLNCAWETIEHTGWCLHELRNSPTGVFIGAQVPAGANWRELLSGSEYSVTSPSLAMLANQVSYHFNLMGPSAAYCTACSAGLTALHSALTALNQGDCEQVLVGSVTHLGSARQSCGFNNLGVLSPEGKCNSFDANANGYMRSEGCFAFAIKPLEAAELDGNRIFAVIEATAMNTAGAADQSEGLLQGRYITAPTLHSQVSVMKSAAARAQRKAQEFDYVEAHATGTVVGDRIEGNAISEAFGSCDRDEPLRISSVKSNLGHLEAAAFHASLLKIILMLERRTFAPISKNFFEPNPDIDFGSCPMQVQTRCEPFPNRPVVIGINSFGFGGSNGHCVVTEYRPKNKPVWSIPLAPKGGFMVPLSARSPAALVKGAQSLREYLGSNPVDLYTLVGNLARRRSHFAYRTSFATLNHKELVEKILQFEEEFDPATASGQETGDRRIAMAFSGQGTQWSGCGRQLYNSNPVFRRVVDTIENHWLEHADFSLREACFFETQEKLNEVRLAQPVIFMVQCALFELFKTWGIHPQVVVGHSSGEVAAAYAGGALSLADATRLIFHRSHLQQRTTGSGRMLAIGLDEASLKQVLDDLKISHEYDFDCAPQVQFACFNSPASVVICGKEPVIELIVEALHQQNIQNRILPGNVAFHSSAMDEIQDDVEADLSFLNRCKHSPHVPFISSVTGSATRKLDSAYWWSNIRQPVDFVAAMETINRDFTVDLFVEISPDRALLSMVAQCMGNLDPQPACIPSLVRGVDERTSFNETLGVLYQEGVNLDFESQFPCPEPIAHHLPGHHKELQVAVDRTIDADLFLHEGGYSHGPLAGHKIHCDHELYEASLSKRDIPYLTHHKVQLSAIMPAAGYIELVLEALNGQPVHFEEIEFILPCPIPEIPVRLQTALRSTPGLSTQYSFAISSRPVPTEPNSKIESELHCRGQVQLLEKNHKVDVPENLSNVDTSGFVTVLENPETGETEFYDRMEATLGKQFEYGPQFKTLKQIKINQTTLDYLIEVELDEQMWETGNAEGYVLCPPLVDGVLQIFAYNLMQATDLYGFPLRVKNTTFLGKPTTPRITAHVSKSLESHLTTDMLAQLTLPIGEISAGDLRFYDSVTGELFLRIEQYIFFAVNSNWTSISKSKHIIDWQPKFMEPFEFCEDSPDESPIELEALITDLACSQPEKPRRLHIVELAGNCDPEQTMLNRCVASLSEKESQIEYWMVNNTSDQTKACYEFFHKHNLPLRFAAYDEESLIDSEFKSGLLRICAANILVLHREDNDFKDEDWEAFRQLAVTGGLALISHSNTEQISPPAGWRTVGVANNLTLLQAQHMLSKVENVDVSSKSRLVIGDWNNAISKWRSCINQDNMSASYAESTEQAINRIIEKYETSDRFNEIDYFFRNTSDDPTGEQACARLVELVQCLIHYQIEEPNEVCRINIVTQNAAMNIQNPGSTSLWGIARAMAVEIGNESGIEIRLYDIETLTDMDTLAWLVQNDVREREIAIRDNQIWAPRLVHMRDWYPQVCSTDNVAYFLSLEHPGQLNGLQFKTRQLPELGDNDVEVKVEYAGLNFRDVMVTLGMLPALAYERSMLGNQVGMEASGVVRRVGRKVSDHQIGDRVLLIQNRCIANRTVVNENQVFRKPDCLSMDEAASVLSVYVTAYYALIQLARLECGQKVLIHSAMGGVGQAAIDIAKHSGAVIYATAGSSSKRAQLLARGVCATFDSHSFDWYDELMQETSGEGVDVVLNSLAGHHVMLCLQALKPGGWHCEIGKIDIYADQSMSLGVFRKNLRFAAIDIDRLMCDDPILARQMSKSCLELLAKQEVNPVSTTIFDYQDYAKALRLMISGQHQGKLVLKAPPSDLAAKNLLIADQRPYLKPDATYLVTGGFGGFGTKLIPYLVAVGARHVTLIDHSPERGRTAEWIKSNSGIAFFDLDVEIDIFPGDVSNFEDVEKCIAKLQRPLKGVFHLGGVLDDRLLPDLTAGSITKVFTPKAKGALNLHNATLDCELDYFVLFSSVASVFGNVGQSNYCAASAYLDGLAAYRQQIGLPALSYNMAGVAETGMVARSYHVMRMIRASGMPPVSLSFTMRNLDFAMRSMPKNNHLITALFEWPSWTIESNEYMRSGHCIANQDSFEVGLSSQLTLESAMTQIVEKVQELCGHDEGTVDEPLSSFGLTSISVAELGAFIQTQFHYQVSAVDLMTTSTCRSIAEAIIKGDQKTDEDESGTTTSESQSVAPIRRRIRPKPSEFAASYEDHFPTSIEKYG